MAKEFRAGRRKMKRYLIPIIIILVLASGVLVSCGKSGSNQFEITGKDIRVGQFWQEVQKFRKTKGEEQLQFDNLFLAGKISPQLWMDNKRRIIEDMADFPETLRSTVREYRGVPITKEEWAIYKQEKGVTSAREWVEFSMLFEKRQMPSPLLHPKDELINLYLSFKPETEKYSFYDDARWQTDWATVFLLRDVIINTFESGSNQKDFLAELSKYETPLGMLFQETGKEYITAYHNIPNAIIKTLHSTEEQRVILEYYSTATPMRRQELRSTSGIRLIATFELELQNTRQNLRQLCPELDAWLLFWGFTDTLLTQEAKQMYLGLCQKYAKQP